MYLDFAKANNIAPVSVDLDNGAQGHWLGDKNAKVTLVFLHGTSCYEHQPNTWLHILLLAPRRIYGTFAVNAQAADTPIP